MPPLHKVTVFITREAPNGQQLALFEHPYAGIQIPAGTVDPGESADDAAVREAAEETGLTGLSLVSCLGNLYEFLPPAQRVVEDRTTVYARPDPGSFDWAILPRGATVNIARERGEYIHITYLEYDSVTDPRYVTYQITGWVRKSCLASQRLRHFYHFAYTGERSDPWEVETDHHRLRVFWAPLNALPEIVKPQREWLKMLKEVDLQ